MKKVKDIGFSDMALFTVRSRSSSLKLCSDKTIMFTVLMIIAITYDTAAALS